jgi:predicted DNA-binding transcriptional regulator AlpA
MNVTEIKNTIVLNEKQTAKRLGIGYSTLKLIRRKKGISHVKIGSRVGYTLKNIEQFIERNAVSSVVSRNECKK